MDLKKKFRKLWNRFHEWYAYSVRKISGETPLIEFSDVIYFSGIVMVGLGIGGRYGLITSGALLILTVRPLWSFIWKDNNNG